VFVFVCVLICACVSACACLCVFICMCAQVINGGDKELIKQPRVYAYFCMSACVCMYISVGLSVWVYVCVRRWSRAGTRVSLRCLLARQQRSSAHLITPMVMQACPLWSLPSLSSFSRCVCVCVCVCVYRSIHKSVYVRLNTDVYTAKYRYRSMFNHCHVWACFQGVFVYMCEWSFNPYIRIYICINMYV